MADVPLRDLLQNLAEERNLDLRGYKPSSLERRIRRRLQQLKIGSYAEYLTYIEQRPAEVNELLNAILINVTMFFRDPPLWQILETKVLPELFASVPPKSIFRVWSTACASGEEAYSLAILLAEVLGNRINDYAVKVYGTDVDEEALAVARHGVYPARALRNVRPEWREKYFAGQDVCRVSRNIRRLCIFGRNNLTADAPISHLRLLMCRNVLIYFDVKLQMQLLARFHYALEPGGVLVLGKSESLLAQSTIFHPLDSRWRIFRRVDSPAPQVAGQPLQAGQEGILVAKARQDYELLKLYHESLLQVLEPGILVLDPKQVIISENAAVSRHLQLKEQPLVGQRLEDSALATSCPELLELLRRHMGGDGEPSRFEYTHPSENDEHATIAVTVKPIVTPKGGRAGTLIYLEDVSPRHRLQSTVEELQTTSEELQSTNEELETSNEELQSTNEELETTNEELQSANEELETTNEELQALNEELGTTNEELEVRSRELDSLNQRYAETLEKTPWPVILVAKDGRIETWNTAAEELFGLPAKSIVGLEVKQLPLPEKLRSLLYKEVRLAASQNKPRTTLNFYFESRTYKGPLDVRCAPLSDDRLKNVGVLVVLESHKGGRSESETVRRRGVLTRRAASTKKKKSKGAKRPARRKR